MEPTSGDPTTDSAENPRRSTMSRSSFFALFHLELDRKTDILALAAFVLSVSGLIYQGILAIKKPDILQFPPDQIVFYSDKSSGIDYLQVGAQLVYVNNGKGDRNAVLKAERMFFDLGGKSYELKWQNFVSYSSNGPKLDFGDPEPAIPSVIKSGEGTSHETHFAPRTFHIATQSDERRYKNFLRWDNFVSEIEKVTELDLRIVSEFYGLEDKETRVYVEINPGVIYALKTNGWSAPSAWVRESTSRPNAQTPAPTSPQHPSLAPRPAASATAATK
jgi:hypothetical protein